MFYSTGPRAQGHATATALDSGGVMSGTVEGRIDGYAVNLTVSWDGGSVGKYEGSVDANGFASGVTYDAKNPSSTATWSSQRPFLCLTPAAN
jgi:hypothetical protein